MFLNRKIPGEGLQLPSPYSTAFLITLKKIFKGLLCNFGRKLGT